MNGKTIYKCKVNGDLGRSLCGKYSAICSRISVVNSRCCAHGNTKCEHKKKLSVMNKLLDKSTTLLPDLCKCSECNVTMTVAEAIADFGHHDGWEMKPYTEYSCPYCDDGGYIDDYFYKEFKRTHLFFEDANYEPFNSREPWEWLTRKDVKWFYNNHVLTLGVNEHVDTDFQRITRIK